MAPTVNSRWFFDLESRLFDELGQRLDVGGVRRWSNPDAPDLREGNHAALEEGEGLIPDQLVQVFDAQQQDGAVERCVDLYGPPDSRDALCLQMGLHRSRDAAIHVVAFEPEVVRPAAHASDNRPAPPVVALDPREWVDAVTEVRGGDIAAWQRTALMAEAALPMASFFSIRIGEAFVACLARYDFGDAAQIASIAVDSAFRKTGFATAILKHALREANHDRLFGVIAENNRGMLRVASRAGAEIAMQDARRRYVGPWK